MSLEMWSQLKKYEDGSSLNADTLNIPIRQLGDRTSYLYARLKELMSSGKMSSIILTDVTLSTVDGEAPEVGNVVFLDQDRGVFAAARATMSLYDDFKAAESAFTVGILQSKDGKTGDSGNVIIYGSLNMNPGGDAFKASNVIESGEEFRPGRYYLSANEAGHLTANPNGPRIYVCTIGGTVNSAGGLDGSAIVTPQFLDIGTSHVHRTAVLTARPAGTSSVDGYVPIGEQDDHGPLALRFGGTWTAKGKVDYGFYIDQGSVGWPGPVVLRWTENGIHDESFRAEIHAPDEEVYISNGLTARLSIGASDQNNAYSNLEQEMRSWETLTFPDAGKGWLAHEMFAVADNGGVEGLKVAIKGKLVSSPSTVNVAFPSDVRMYAMESMDMDDLPIFSYGGKSYEFTLDVKSYSGENIPVALGTCLADSALFLAEALSENEDSDSSSSPHAKFAVFETDSGSGATLLVIDGSGDLYIGEDAMSYDEIVGRSFEVVGASGLNMVIYDGTGRVLSSSPVVQDASSYVWNNAGDLSVMVYQDVEGYNVVVPSGTVASAMAVDDEPDAIYDYVIGMEPQIANYWPPVPPKSAALIVNGVEMDNKALVPESPTVSFGRDTIHWFEDDSGRRPWPESFVSRSSYVDPAKDKSEIMHWVRSFQGATGPVTSIQVKDGSPIKIYGYGTFDKANTGDLEIAADFDFRMENGGAPGFNVPKRTREGILLAGPVVERIVGGAGVSVISKAGCPDGQGTVIVALENGAYSNQFSDIALENAEQAKIGMFPYIRLKGYSGDAIAHPSAFTATMRVPINLPDGRYSLRLSASVFGEDGFQSSSSIRYACINMSYNILPDLTATGAMMYGNLKTSLLKPDSERVIDIPFGHEASQGWTYDGFDPILITTDDAGESEKSDVVEKVLKGSIPSRSEFRLQTVTPELRPGYLVGIRISRAVMQTPDRTPYTGALGFMNLSWSIVSSDPEYAAPRNTGDILSGYTIRSNTPAGIRDAVDTIGKALGAEVDNS